MQPLFSLPLLLHPSPPPPSAECPGKGRRHLVVFVVPHYSFSCQTACKLLTDSLCEKNALFTGHLCVVDLS